MVTFNGKALFGQKATMFNFDVGRLIAWRP
jgi:hypothetical protein